MLNNVSLPRLGAMQAIIDVMGANKELAKLSSANNNAAPAGKLSP